MKDIKLDEAGDITFELTNKDESLAQAVRIRLKTLAGEYFLDPGAGVPMFDILGKKVSPAAVSHMIRDQVQGIGDAEQAEVISANVDQESRRLVIKLKVNGEKLNV